MVADNGGPQLLLSPPKEHSTPAIQSLIELGHATGDLLDTLDSSDNLLRNDPGTLSHKWHDGSVIDDVEMRDRYTEIDSGAAANAPHNPVVIVSPRYSPKLHPYERRFAGSQAGQQSTERPLNQTLSSPTGSGGSREAFSSELRSRLDGRDEGTVSPQGDSAEVEIRIWPNNRSWVSRPMVRALGLILLWYAFSMCLSLYNKVLIGHKHGSFPAPLLMTTVHFILQFLISSTLLKFVFPSWMPTTRLPWRDYSLRVLPTAAATAFDIALSNLSLAYITLTFYTMCKSSAPVFLLLFAFAFRIEDPSWKLTGVMLVISLGVLCTVAGETQFHLLGFTLIMLSAVTSGLRWVLIQVLLQKDKLGLTNPLVTLMYLTPIMAAVCGVFSLVHEPLSLLLSSPYFSTPSHALWSCLIIVFGAFLAFFMIMSEFMLVLETSAVTFAVAGTVKEGATILVSHMVFGDRFTRINLVGIFVILLGVSLFNLYKSTKDSHPSAVQEVKLSDSERGDEESSSGIISDDGRGGGATREEESEGDETISLLQSSSSSALLSSTEPQGSVRSGEVGGGTSSPSATGGGGGGVYVLPDRVRSLSIERRAAAQKGPKGVDDEHSSLLQESMASGQVYGQINVVSRSRGISIGSPPQRPSSPNYPSYQDPSHGQKSAVPPPVASLPPLPPTTHGPSHSRSHSITNVEMAKRSAGVAVPVAAAGIPSDTLIGSPTAAGGAHSGDHHDHRPHATAELDRGEIVVVLEEGGKGMAGEEVHTRRPHEYE